MAVLTCATCQAAFEFSGKGKARYCPRCKPFLNAVRQQEKRAMQYGLTTHFSMAEWLNLIDLYGGKCLRCGRPGDRYHNLTIGHVLPMRQGGSNTIDNIQPLCHSCNVKKSDTFRDYRPTHLMVYVPSDDSRA
jgi:5-methylcytosine-specific restriction endonuclease McrA